LENEKLIADFSGGMNASVAVDKLSDKECLLAENIRFDEQGNVLITGANTLQNTASLSGSVHSVFLDPILGGIAGAGTNVYLGRNFTALSTSTATNSNASKMSFGVANNRVYMDLSRVGYFKDISISDLVTVDWAPPSATSAVATGPNNGTGTFTALPSGTTGAIEGTATAFGFSLGTQAMQGIQVTIVATTTFLSTGNFQGTLTQTANLFAGGASVGTASSVLGLYPAGSGAVYTATFTFGNANSLWGYQQLSTAQVNASNFGFVFGAVVGQGNFRQTISKPQCTAYQSAGGFVAAVGTTGTLTGTYQWKLTFVAAGGEESDASIASALTTLTAQQGTLTAIPNGDVRTTSRNIYRKGGLLSSYYLVGSVPDNTTTTFSDNLSDLAALTQAIILAGDTVGDEPNTRLGNQAVQFPTLHYDRVFWASGNMLIWSKPLNGFAYPADFSTPVGDGKAITGIFSMGGQLFILKPDSIWSFSGTDENSFLLSKTLSPVGTDWPFTAVLAGGAASGFYFTGRILFANSRGIWAFNGYTSNKMTPKLDLWFRQVDRTNLTLFGNTGFHPPEILNASAVALNSAAANPLFYYLAYAEVGQNFPTAMLVFDLEKGNITKRSLSAQSLTADPVQGYIYGGDALGDVFQVDDWAAHDNGLGGNVNVDFQDKYRDFGMRGSRFALEGLEFMLATNGQSITPFIYFDEGTANESLAPISTPSHTPIKVFRKTTSAESRFCRNVSFRLNYQGAGINSSNIPNIQLIHVKAYFDVRGARARTGENP
jgi:hypothetical protein